MPKQMSHYVRSVPCAGDLPFLEVGLGNTQIFMTSDKSGRFQVCTNLVPDITRKQQDDDGVFKQPDWAFHLTNGTDELYLRDNGKCMMSLRNPKSRTEILTLMSEADAKAVSASFFQAFAGSRWLQRHRRKLKPLGAYYAYKVNCVTMDPQG